MEESRNPISRARALSFCTQIVAVADLQGLFGFGPPDPPPRSMEFHSSEVSTAVCVTHIPGDFLGWKKASTIPPREADSLGQSFPVCMCVLLDHQEVQFPFPSNLDWDL